MKAIKVLALPVTLTTVLFLTACDSTEKEVPLYVEPSYKPIEEVIQVTTKAGKLVIINEPTVEPVPVVVQVEAVETVPVVVQVEEVEPVPVVEQVEVEEVVEVVETIGAVEEIVLDTTEEL